MKVLMLGWEYPPHITGGLGTACEGLTVALSRLSVRVDFVVPEIIGGEWAPHMNLLGSWDLGVVVDGQSRLATHDGITTHRIPAALMPYWNESTYQHYLTSLRSFEEGVSVSVSPSADADRGAFLKKSSRKSGSGGRHYSENILQEVAEYAANVLALAGRRDFDVIHAHDWMTFPAGVALAQATGRPLVVHVHSLEYDRAGVGGNSAIKDIEALGINSARAVIAVSHYTRSIICREHGVEESKLYVVHNGVYPKEVIDTYREEEGSCQRKRVLFLGRVTYQKGPDYFVEAAAKIVPHIPNVLFVMAGSGDMLPRMMRRVQDLGLEKNFEFTGFLKGKEVERMFSLADLYVMPSVSEPFGITALEAISHDTPVIISRQSGVSEVLNHALKVDFWDVDKMSDLIINALLYDELRESMVLMARKEVEQLRWDAAALKTQEIYQKVV
jgi:glycogen synthase